MKTNCLVRPDLYMSVLGFLRESKMTNVADLATHVLGLD